VQKEVLQTAVSFTDHQILAAGTGESGARRALKCCIFDGLLRYVAERGDQERARSVIQEMRRKSLQGRRRRADARKRGETSGELQAKLDELQREQAREGTGLASPEDHLGYVADILAHPAQFLSGRTFAIHLSRLGIKHDSPNAASGAEIPLFEIRVASQSPRIGVLARFPREELLPRPDFVREADLFLTL
jgi:hypothetical protein